MEIAFRVRDVEVPDSLRHRTRDRVIRLAALCGTELAVVSFSEERNHRIAEREVCQIVLFGPGRGATVRVRAAATDLTIAAERVVAKLELRAARLRGRTVGRRRPRWCSGLLPLGLPAGALPGSGDHWVHFPTNRSTARREPGAVDPAIREVGEAAVIDIGERLVDCPDETAAMTPEEAALEMAAQGRDLYFFLNAETGRPAAVYARKDGNIALHDASTSRTAMRL
jgi:ribosome-associated translation inhibitor RaiA